MARGRRSRDDEARCPYYKGKPFPMLARGLLIGLPPEGLEENFVLPRQVGAVRHGYPAGSLLSRRLGLRG